MIYQETIGDFKTTYDGTPEEIAELYSKLNLPEELEEEELASLNIFNPVDNVAMEIKAASQRLKEQPEPINFNITVNGEMDVEKLSKQMQQKAKEVFQKQFETLATRMGYVNIDKNKNKKEIKSSPLDNIRRLVTNDNFEYEIGFSDVRQIEPMLSNNGEPIMYLLMDKEDNVICGIPICSVRKIFFE